MSKSPPLPEHKEAVNNEHSSKMVRGEEASMMKKRYKWEDR